MNRLDSKNNNTFRRKNRVRSSLRANTARPRLSVDISNRHITAQVIDDATHKTLVSATTVGKTVKGTMTEKAVLLGKEIAKKSKEKKIKQVKLDRGPKLYHGRIKAFAEAAREEGLVV